MSHRTVAQQKAINEKNSKTKKAANAKAKRQQALEIKDKAETFLSCLLPRKNFISVDWKPVKETALLFADFLASPWGENLKCFGSYLIL